MRLFKPNVQDMEDKHDVHGLIKALGDRDATVRADAAKALGWIGDKSSVMPLVRALAGQSDLVSWVAA